MNNPILYIVLNGELKMSPGKAAAQAVHSAMLLSKFSHEDFVSAFRRTVIVLEAKNAEQIKNLAWYLGEAEVDSDYYIDEGVNEVDAYSVTALAAFVGENEELRTIFESFPLYGGHVTVHRTEGLFQDRKEKVVLPGNVEIDSRIAFNALKRSV